jgi:alcohol dehydrogenase (cytochrome c)
MHVSADDLDKMSCDDKPWIMPAKNYASTRFRGLNQVNAGNAGQLRVAWTFSLGSSHGQEAAPLIVNGTMYVVGVPPEKMQTTHPWDSREPFSKGQRPGTSP